MANTIEVKEDGIIYNFFKGDQDSSNLRQNAADLKKAIELQKSKNQKALVLMEVSEVNLFDNLAKDVATESLSSLKYDKLAVVGANPIVRQIATLLVHATGNAQRVNFFNEEAEGLAWLKA